jgi:hypothetical protein
MNDYPQLAKTTGLFTRNLDTGALEINSAIREDVME